VVLAAQYRKEGFIMALSDVKLKNLKAADRAFKVSDIDGLYVYVSIKGTKSFTISLHKFKDRRVPESSKP
jgi:hypothetical protein